MPFSASLGALSKIKIAEAPAAPAAIDFSRKLHVPRLTSATLPVASRPVQASVVHPSGSTGAISAPVTPPSGVEGVNSIGVPTAPVLVVSEKASMAWVAVVKFWRSVV